MSDKPDEAKPSTPEKSSKPMLPLILVGVVALVGGAAVGNFALPKLLGGGAAHAEAEAKEGEDAEPHGEDAAPEGGGHAAEPSEPTGSFADRVLQLDPFVVNVTGETYPRYLKVQVAFETASPAGKALLEERVAPIRDLTISLLSSKRLADVTDFEGKALLKDDLRHQVNELLGKEQVEAVLFTEFVVQ
jgi:flagellar basal body-associated protein FliL